MIIAYQLQDIDSVASMLLEQIKSNVWLFYGDMGVGKTSLIKTICKHIGVRDLVSSPTFSIVNQYSSENKMVFHFDLYRLESTIELMDIGFEDYFQRNALVCIEWPKLSEALLTEPYTKICMVRGEEDNHRKLTVHEFS